MGLSLNGSQGTPLACDLCHNPIRDRDARPYSIARNNVLVDFATRRFDSWMHIVNTAADESNVMSGKRETEKRLFEFALSHCPCTTKTNKTKRTLPTEFYFATLWVCVYSFSHMRISLHCPCGEPKPLNRGAFFCADFEFLVFMRLSSAAQSRMVAGSQICCCSPRFRIFQNRKTALYLSHEPLADI